MKNCQIQPSADDLIYVASPTLETRYEFENNTLSQRFTFKYENFESDYIVACRIGANITFAVKDSNSNRLTSINTDQYQILGDSISNNGEFEIQIKGNIDQQDQKCLVCGFATNFFVMETSCIRLIVTKKPEYYIEQKPNIAATGDKVYIYCIVSGYPFPQVKFEPPENLNIEKILISNPNNTLRVIKYQSVISYIDTSWSDKQVKCQVFNDEIIFEQKIMKINIKKYNESIVYNDGAVKTIAIICVIISGFLVASLLIGVVLYMKRKNKKEHYYCMKLDDKPNDNSPLNFKHTNNDYYNSHNDNNYYGIPHQSQPQHISKHLEEQPLINPNCAKFTNDLQYANFPIGINQPPQNIHYQPQQIINVTQKHKHKPNPQISSNFKCNQPSLKSNSSENNKSYCESITTVTETIPNNNKSKTKYNISNSAFV